MMLTFQQTRFDLAWTSTIRIAILAIAFSLAANILSAQTPTAEVRTIEGAEIVGTLVEVTVDQLKLETNAGAKTIELEQIEAIEFPASSKPELPEKAAKFELLDGSSIFVDKFKYADRKIETTLSTWTSCFNIKAKRQQYRVCRRSESDSKTSKSKSNKIPVSLPTHWL